MLNLHQSTSAYPAERRHRHSRSHKHSRSTSEATTVDAPWQQMTQTYTWVVEEEFMKGNKRPIKTEDWVREQQYFFSLRDEDFNMLQSRPSKHSRGDWEELVYIFGVEAEDWMRQEERARRLAHEREKVRARIQDELRRIEARFQQKRDAERRAREEAQRKATEIQEKEKRDRTKLDKLIVNAWANYEKRWTSSARLTTLIYTFTMFSRFSRLPLRRCLHTTPTPGKAPFTLSKATRTVLGASAVTTAYMAWHISREANEIALDAPPTSRLPTEKSVAPSVPKTTRPTDTLSESAASTSSSESDVFVPDAPSDSTISSPEYEGGSSPPDGEAPPADGQPAASGAFNPETGEINWDCPCLGGMAHGPCGPEFREAFSCFVFSEAEPKGINCVDKFQNMQNCFRAHPEVYADEIMDDDDDTETADSKGLSDDNNIPDETPSELATTPKSHIEASPVGSDSP
ncbi:hypothetical protein CVT25_003034 [Psilocybe cyanescens]|uniref:Mitochondrial intermembrane space import and assembly protein 40 n=1 Tax=Psilocybe cyanescens TaxID=93625 RepID=A0A409WN92_PSICY|nr:hypothetical protein CVT25_003034 [Psilocybe cyanescens]